MIRTFYPLTVVYTPKGFVPHAASLRHTCVHCGRFVTAAPRRSLGSVSVPMWPADLSARLRVVALVGRYPHQLADTISPAPPADCSFEHLPMRGSWSDQVLPGVSPGYP